MDEEKKETVEGAVTGQPDVTAQASAQSQAAQTGGNGRNGTGSDAVGKLRAEVAAEEERIAAIRKVCAGEKHAEIRKKAIADGWDPIKAEIEVLRADRPTPPNVSAGVPRDLGPMVLEAAMLMGAQHKVEKLFPEQVLDAAHRQFRGGPVGVAEVICRMATLATGIEYGPRDLRSNLSGVLTAAWSTADTAGILSNYANKTLLEAYSYGEDTDLQIAKIRAVSDFKTSRSYRLLTNGTYEKVPPGGAIKHGVLSDEVYTNKADTYGIQLTIDRQMIINDDLGAFDGLLMDLGIGAVVGRNEIFWTDFLANLEDDATAFFDSSNSNVKTGAGSAFSHAAMAAAILAMRKFKDPNNQRITVKPYMILVPPELEGDAEDMYTADQLADAPSSAKTGITYTKNRYKNRYPVKVSRYLSETGFHASVSTTAWYLLADPRFVAAVEICFLDGVQTPTIQSVSLDASHLGIGMRGYVDFGVNLQNPRGGIRSAGA